MLLFSFKDFIADTWVPSEVILKTKDAACSNEGGNNDGSASYAKIIANNCVDFLADVEDLKLIPRSPFRNYRMCHVFEKFIMHGAIRHVSSLTLTISDNSLSSSLLLTIVANFVDSNQR